MTPETFPRGTFEVRFSGLPVSESMTSLSRRRPWDAIAPESAGARLRLALPVSVLAPRDGFFRRRASRSMTVIRAENCESTTSLGRDRAMLVGGLFGWIYRRNLERAIPRLTAEIEGRSNAETGGRDR